MAHYSKIERSIINDGKFNQLSDEAKLIFFSLLVHPNLTSLGAMRLTLAGLASEIGWNLEKLKRALEELLSRGMVQIDEQAHFFWFPNFLKHNQPESPNVIKSWGKSLHCLPECMLKNTLIHHVKGFAKALPHSFQAALPEVFLEASKDLSEGLSKSPAKSSKGLNKGVLKNQIGDAKDLSEENINSKINYSEGLAEENINSEMALTTKLRESVTVAVTVTEAVTVADKNSDIVVITRDEQDTEPGILHSIVAPVRPSAELAPPVSDVLFVFNAWKTTLCHPQAILDGKRKQLIQQALRWGYSVDQLCQAIKGCSLTPHNMGSNDRGQRYDGLHVILKDADQIDRFIHNAVSPPQLRNAGHRLTESNIAACQNWLNKKRAKAQGASHGN